MHVKDSQHQFTSIHCDSAARLSMMQLPTGAIGMHEVNESNQTILPSKPPSSICREELLSLAGLRCVVEELCRALSSSLQDERVSAEECVQRARTILRLGPSDPIGADAP